MFTAPVFQVSSHLLLGIESSEFGLEEISQRRLRHRSGRVQWLKFRIGFRPISQQCWIEAERQQRPGN
jgi:hypothetical protein